MSLDDGVMMKVLCQEHPIERKLNVLNSTCLSDSARMHVLDIITQSRCNVVPIHLSNLERTHYGTDGSFATLFSKRKRVTNIYW